MASSKVSFTVRRPSPPSRSESGNDSDAPSFKIPTLPRHLNGKSNGASSPLARSSTSSPAPKRTHNEAESDSDQDEEVNDELVTGFDRFGVQRLHDQRKKQPDGPLVIPALQNRDWRELARKRRAAKQYVPDSAAANARTGADGSVGGLGTRDAINSGPQLTGLQLKAKRVKLEEDFSMTDADSAVEVKEEIVEETEDQRALRALLAGDDPTEPQISAIPVAPVTETDALKQDVEVLPDEATLADYERVPVSQFGAALLRGMGWKEGGQVTKGGEKKKPIEPYLPTARPALLGIGAKEREVHDDGSKKKRYAGKPDKRYIPVVRKEKEGSSGSGTPSREVERSSRSAPSSRRASRSPPRRDRDRDYDRGRDRDYDSKDRDRDRGRRSERRDRDDDVYDSRDRRRDYDDRRDKDYDRDRDMRRDQDYDSDRERRRR